LDESVRSANQVLSAPGSGRRLAVVFGAIAAVDAIRLTMLDQWDR
jgi:hypothetical protein